MGRCPGRVKYRLEHLLVLIKSWTNSNLVILSSLHDVEPCLSPHILSTPLKIQPKCYLNGFYSLKFCHLLVHGFVLKFSGTHLPKKNKKNESAKKKTKKTSLQKKKQKKTHLQKKRTCCQIREGPHTLEKLFPPDSKSGKSWNTSTLETNLCVFWIHRSHSISCNSCW